MLFSLLACAVPPSPGPVGPNVLLISVDTLRADHVGAYGYNRDTTPTIDALADSGVRFSRTYSARGATWPSLTTLMTSWYPSEHGVRENSTTVSDAPTTVAETLRTHGYRSEAILTNAQTAHWEGFDAVHSVLGDALDARAAAEAVAWLGTKHTGPWFLWVHLTSPHDPYVNHPEVRSFLDPDYTGPISDAQGPLVRAMYTPPSKADMDAIIARYDSEVANSDAAIATVLAALKAHQLDSSTLVVVTSDHGEELAEHPPFLFHFMSPWDAVLRVPLVAAQPGRLPEGVVVRDAVGLIDVAPTVLDWLDLPVPAAWHGSSLAPLLTSRHHPNRPVFSELSVEALIVHQGRWALISNPNRYVAELAPPMQLREAGLTTVQNKWPLPSLALFDVVDDPREQHDLSGSQGPVVERLTAELETFRQTTGWPGKSTAPASAEVRERLEALGYTTGDL